MTKYKLEIEYLGTIYSGWQKQTEDISIQEAVEKATFDFCGEDVLCYGCGRTDSGVHAISMPAHIETKKEYDEYKMLMGINFHLSKKNHDITILDVKKVDDDFHARFSCKKRYYVYKILNRTTKPSIMKNRIYWVPNDLNIDLMNKCAQHLIGKHDFSSFRASGCQASSPIKTLDSIEISKSKNEINISISAPSFLYNQVRNIVGTLLEVGKEKISEEKFIEIFKSCDRTKAGPTAPAMGLYFLKADY